MPAGTSDFFTDSGPHAKNQPNRKVSFRDRAHGDKFHMCTKGLGTGPLPRPRNVNWAKPRTN